MTAVLADEGAAIPASALKRCAAIGGASERLACYDQLAGRPVPLTGSAAAAPAATGAVAAAAGAKTPAPAAAPPESFGLYAAEHPKAPAAAAPSLSGRVVGLGASANGHPTVALEGGALWEMDDGDPLLADGDVVTIKRAALGSFLLTTPQGRSHRVHRLR